MRKIQSKLKGHLGQEAGNHAAGDIGFYDWIAGPEDRPTDIEMAVWLIDDFKEETDPQAVRRLLDNWKQTCSKDEYEERLRLLDKLLPQHHPFHQIREQ